MKTKKTGKTMRVAGLLLALVLVTSCFVGGTFAKYVTSGTGADLARVAMWGVKVTAHREGDIFASEYDNTVVAGGEYKVIAPGTKKENAAVVTVSGKPEVAVNVTYSAEHFALTGKWAYNDGQPGSTDEYYCPLIFKITGMVNGVETTETINCLEKNSVAEVKAAVGTALAKFNASYPAGTDLSTKDNGGLKISWEWPFVGTTEKNSAQSDEKDTFLGNLATATGQDSHNTIPAVHVIVTATVTQVD